MNGLHRSKVLHLILLTLVFMLLQPADFPAAILQEFTIQTAAVPGGQESLPATLENISLMYPGWEQPVPIALQAVLAGENPHLAAEIIQDRDIADLNDEPCLLIKLQLQTNDLAAAYELWKTCSIPCCLQPDILSPLIQYTMDIGDFAAAADLQSMLIEQFPQDPENYLTLAKIYSVSNPEKALAPLQIARSITGENSILVTGLIRTIEDTRAEDNPAYTLASVGTFYAGLAEWKYATHALSQAVHLEPEYAEALAYLGNALDRSGDNGLEELEMSAAINPDSVVVWIFLAQHWMQNSSLEQAEEALLKAGRIDPQNPVVAATTGELYARRGDHDAASMAYFKACELEPDIPNFWILLAEYSLAYEVNTDNLGLLAARRAVLLDPDNAHALDLLGFSHYLGGSQAVASRMLKLSVSLDPASASAAFHLGLIYIEEGSKEPGIDELERAVSLDPSGYYGELAKRTLAALER